MSTKQNINHKKIKKLLNISLAKLEQPTLAQLRGARARAIALHEARQAAPAFAWAGNMTWQAASQHKPHILAAAALVVAILFSAAAYWQQTVENDAAEADISILTDDLPMHVYLD